MDWLIKKSNDNSLIAFLQYSLNDELKGKIEIKAHNRE